MPLLILFKKNFVGKSAFVVDVLEFKVVALVFNFDYKKLTVNVFVCAVSRNDG
jgi:hypothetical protein